MPRTFWCRAGRARDERAVAHRPRRAHHDPRRRPLGRAFRMEQGATVGEAEVLVAAGGDDAACEQSYGYYGAPVVSRISLSHGPVRGGTRIHVFGSGFHRNQHRQAAMCRFGGVAVPAIRHNDIRAVQCEAPASNRTGPVNVEVSLNGGADFSTTDTGSSDGGHVRWRTFTYTEASIARVEPPATSSSSGLRSCCTALGSAAGAGTGAASAMWPGRCPRTWTPRRLRCLPRAVAPHRKPNVARCGRCDQRYADAAGRAEPQRRRLHALQPDADLRASPAAARALALDGPFRRRHARGHSRRLCACESVGVSLRRRRDRAGRARERVELLQWRWCCHHPFRFPRWRRPRLPGPQHGGYASTARWAHVRQPDICADRAGTATCPLLGASPSSFALVCLANSPTCCRSCRGSRSTFHRLASPRQSTPDTATPSSPMRPSC